jgi:hypothetical protein
MWVVLDSEYDALAKSCLGDDELLVLLTTFFLHSLMELSPS